MLIPISESRITVTPHEGNNASLAPAKSKVISEKLNWWRDNDIDHVNSIYFYPPKQSKRVRFLSGVRVRVMGYGQASARARSELFNTPESSKSWSHVILILFILIGDRFSKTKSRGEDTKWDGSRRLRELNRWYWWRREGDRRRKKLWSTRIFLNLMHIFITTMCFLFLSVRNA